jgi:hypothetical protein
MALNLFKKPEKTDEQIQSEFAKKIDTALMNAQADKRNAQTEIERIKSWAAEAIVETYASIFPNGHLTYYREKYKTDALAKYEQIKNDNAGKIGEEKAEKCDNIVKAYLSQIKLRESKLILYDKIVSKYQDTKSRLKELEKNKVEQNKLDKHEDRLKQLDGVEKDYVDAMNDTAEMEELEKEFELKAEYANQLALLNEKYKDGKVEDHTSVQAFTDEIDKITQEIE